MDQTTFTSVVASLVAMVIAGTDVCLPPTILTKNEKVMYSRPSEEENQAYEVTLHCVARGTPDPHIEWLRDGDFLSLGRNKVQNGGNLTIKQFSRIDEGYYQCRASNVYGTAMSDVTFLRRAVLSKFSAIEVEPFTATVGEPLQVPCNQRGSVPAPNLHWVLADSLAGQISTQIQMDRRVTIDQDGHLYFAHVIMDDARDGKIYKCNSYNVILDNTQGGSYSRIDVTDVPPGSDTNRSPAPMYFTPSPHVVLVGSEAHLKCFFSGNPTPEVHWTRAGGRLPTGRYSIISAYTELVISNVQMSDQGQYICSAVNNLGQESEDVYIDLHVQAPPTFEANLKPEDANKTAGESHTFHCAATGEPTPHITWYINGEPLDKDDPGPRTSVSEDSQNLVVSRLCKTCAAGDRATDLRVIQCNASNVHGYAFASVYLNVLEPTEITVAPQPVTYEEGMTEVNFTCEATSDASTPMTITWLKGNDNDRVYPDEDPRINITSSNCASILSIQTHGLSADDVGARYEAQYTCLADNGYVSASGVAKFDVPGVDVVVGPTDGTSLGMLGDLWWVILLLVLLLALTILILCCCICIQRNKGDSYPVDKKERQHGRDPLKEIEDDGYNVYQRPLDTGTGKESRASLASTVKLDSEDELSLSQYGDPEFGRFNEDGSFIGIYATGSRKTSNAM